MKIAVYAISKNESQFVERFCKSAADADLILVADTGSTDDTRALAEQHGAKVYDIWISPWRFDKARDAALALIPREFDVCVSLDLDEVLEPGWRKEIERVWTEQTTRLRYKYDWGSDISFYYEKIHHRHGYYWHHPCHEYPRVDARVTEVYAQTDKLLVRHYPDPSKSRGEYLDLLELSIKEDPSCPRNAFYYARELTFYKKWQEAVIALNTYLALPGATWPNERCYAMRLLAKSYQSLNNYSESVKWARLACAEAPNTREPWVELASIHYHQKQWHNCFAAAKTALDIKNKNLVYTMDPMVWGALPHDLLAISAYNLRLYKLALEHGKIATELEPENQRLLDNLKFYQEKA